MGWKKWRAEAQKRGRIKLVYHPLSVTFPTSWDQG